MIWIAEKYLVKHLRDCSLKCTLLTLGLNKKNLVFTKVTVFYHYSHNFPLKETKNPIRNNY